MFIWDGYFFIIKAIIGVYIPIIKVPLAYIATVDYDR